MAVHYIARPISVKHRNVWHWQWHVSQTYIVGRLIRQLSQKGWSTWF